MFSIACKVGEAFSESEIESFRSLNPALNFFYRYKDSSSFRHFDLLVKHSRDRDKIFSKFEYGEESIILIGFPELKSCTDDFYSTIDGFFIGFHFSTHFIRALRDPVGSRALYYTFKDECYYFASEIKTFKAFKEITIKPRKEAIAEYLSFSFIPGTNTFLESVNEISLGSYLELKENSVGQVDYCNYHKNENGWDDLDEVELKEAFSHALDNSTKICRGIFPEDPVFFLSGGLDSSSILAITVKDHLKSKPRTLSVNFGKDLPNENEFIDMIVDQHQTDHDYLEITPKIFIESISEIFTNVDDPIGDPVVVPNYLMNQYLDDQHKFIFTGEGGDPCLGGPKNKAMLMAKFYGPGFGLNEHNYLEISYLNSFKRCFDDLYLAIPDQFANSTERMVEFLKPYLRNPDLSEFTNRIMLANIKLKATSLIMPKVHKTTMAFGNLSVSPLYTREFIEASMKVPPNYKLAKGDEKFILKRCMKGLVPNDIIIRPKSGMRVPLRIWSSDELIKFYKDYLLSNKQTVSSWIDFDYIKMLLSIKRTERNITRIGLKLWMITSFFHYLENITRNE
tara:strand:+ start:1305 stop:3002 length:1698 start_codon:yes stop_codon:yes gene_type:complete